MKLKIGDYIVIVFFIFAIIIGFKSIKNFSVDSVEIVTPFKKIIIPLYKNKIIKIKGYDGFLILQIKDNKVRVLKSTCLNKICVKTGWINKNGEYIACVPNKILIKLIKKEKNKRDIDFITK